MRKDLSISMVILLMAGTFFKDVNCLIQSPERPIPSTPSATAIETTSDSPQDACPCCLGGRCIWNATSAVLSCRQVLTFRNYPAGCATRIEQLDIAEPLFERTSEAEWPALPSLQRLSISDSELLETVDQLPSMDRLEQLEIVRNRRMENFDWRLLLRPLTAETARLVRLDLSFNRLQYVMGGVLTKLTTLEQLNLSGNLWDCENRFEWVLPLERDGILENGDQLTCQDATKNNSWIDWKYSVLQRERNKEKVEGECKERTPKCDCQFASAGKEGRASYTVQVDCSRRNLTSLPDTLPSFTKELDVRGNSLRSLDQVLVYNSLHLKILIADWNQIQSIRNLSKSVFIRNFNRFSLKHNHIPPSEIPLKEMVETSSEFEQKYVYLYNNSWECDCHLATTIRDWLWKYRHIVNDSSLLLCSLYNKKVPVLNLLPNVVCPAGTYQGNSWWSGGDDAGDDTDALHLMNAIIGLEIFILVVIVVKFSYDSWHYFHHGKLPWIASKLM